MAATRCSCILDAAMRRLVEDPTCPAHARAEAVTRHPGPSADGATHG